LASLLYHLPQEHQVPKYLFSALIIGERFSMVKKAHPGLG